MRRHFLPDPESLIRRLCDYLMYRVGDGPDAEDITSQTFERALRHRETYNRLRGAAYPGAQDLADLLADTMAARPSRRSRTPCAAVSP